MRSATAIRLLAVVLALALTAPATAQDGAPRASESFGTALLYAPETDELLVGEPASAVAPGQIFVFQRDGAGGWVVGDTLWASAETAGDYFGWSLTRDGGRILAGAPRTRGNDGAAYLLAPIDGRWQQVARFESAEEGDRFGQSVALDGPRALIGAHRAGGMLRGAAYVFEEDLAGQWREVAVLRPSEPLDNAAFGWSVALRGTEAFVGAFFENGQAGAVYVFRRDPDGTWKEVQKLVGEAIPGARYGHTVLLDEGNAIVAAPFDVGGKVFIYVKDEVKDEWALQQTLEGDELNGLFGYAIDRAGDRLAIGAYLDNEDVGEVNLFELIDGAWTPTARLLPENDEFRQLFGRSVALTPEGTEAFGGATNADFGAGAAYTFVEEDGTWRQQARLIGTDVAVPSIMGERRSCRGGQSAAFDCRGVDLMAFISLRDVGGKRGIGANDIWGWTDPQTGIEYALVGREDGTAFVDISDPINPVFVGELPLTPGSTVSSWRDIKVYNDHAFIVADASANHGMQVFDLTQLRTVQNPPATFEATAQYTEITRAHNMVINEDTGFGYAVGSNTCGGGLHAIDLRDPLNPTFAGCFATSQVGRGYTHDAQCVVYRGPDGDHRGREICIGSNEQGISVTDVTNKTTMFEIATGTYPTATYVHQGWLSEDHRYFFQDDELDELNGFVRNTRTIVWDLTDLDDPQVLTEYLGTTTASDHNQYVVGSFLLQSNYTAGLRILDISDPANPQEVAYFDTVPLTDDPSFGGSWSNYPFFDSGTIVLTSREFGLFIVRATSIGLAEDPAEVPATHRLAASYPNPFATTTTITLTLAEREAVTVSVFDVLGRRVARLHEGPLGAGTPHAFAFDAGGLGGGTYFWRVEGETFSDSRAITLVR